MTLYFKYILSLLCFVALSLALPVAAEAKKIETRARQAIVIDETTGMVLFEKNADQQMPTSSMSKVMTVYVIFDALKKGQLELDDKFLVSKKAWKKGGSKMFIEVDHYVKVEDLLRGVIVQSGNDATIALAEGLAGTEENFARALTKRAKELGMKNSQFKNASGWPDPEHYSTARDLATLASALIKNFPEYYAYFSEKEFTYNNIRQENRNPLLYRDIGADGIKTGHTEVGGYGLMGSAVHNGRRVIMVLNGLRSEKERAQEGAKLLDWGLKSFETQKLFSADTVVESAAVAMGKEQTVGLVTKQDVVMAVPILLGEDITAKVQVQEPLVAPVTAGQEIGKLTITIPEVNSYELPLYAAEAVAEQGFISRTFTKARHIISGG